jgi:hypothetical protein
MSEDLVSKFIRIENKRGLLRFIHPDQRRRQSDPLALLCNGDEPRDKQLEACEKLHDVDALKQGVVTTWATRDIHLAPHASNEKATFKSWDEHRPHTRSDAPVPADIGKGN